MSDARLVSLVFRIPAESAFQPIHEALATIDRVHRDGDLPEIPIALTRSEREAGGYRFTDRGGVRGILLSRESDRPHLSLVHEVGHILDHQVLALRGQWASESGRLPAVMEAIDRSRAVMRLRQLLRQRYVLVLDQRGHRRRQAVEAAMVRYYLQPKELFARAYAQWVTLRSGDPFLTAQLDRLRDPTTPGEVYYSQWTAEDFTHIADAIDVLMRSRKWLL